jgi:hypothetical protein
MEVSVCIRIVGTPFTCTVDIISGIKEHVTKSHAGEFCSANGSNVPGQPACLAVARLVHVISTIASTLQRHRDGVLPEFRFEVGK